MMRQQYENGTRKVEIQGPKGYELDKSIFVDPIAFTLDDDFLKHRPNTYNEQIVLQMVKDAIQKAHERSLNPFFVPAFAPSFDEEGRLRFEKRKPFKIKSDYDWWEEKAAQFWPERNSRLGEKIAYRLYTAHLIKMLSQKEGFTLNGAWNCVCNESRGLGAYSNNGYEHAFLITGDVQRYQLYDLAGAAKLLAKEHQADEHYWVASGSKKKASTECPIGMIRKLNQSDLSEELLTGFVIHN